MGRRIQSASHRQVSDLRQELENARVADQAQIAALQTQVQTLQTGQGQSQQQEGAQAPSLDQNWMYQTLQGMGVTEPNDYANGIAYMNLAAAVVGKLLEGRNFADAQTVEELRGTVTQAQEQSQQTSDKASADRLQDELDAVYNLYGADNVRPLLDEMAGLYGKPGPGGQPHTLRTAYERLTGASSNGKGPSREQIEAAKRRAGPSAPAAQPSSEVPEKGELTEQQALEQMQRVLDQQ